MAKVRVAAIAHVNTSLSPPSVVDVCVYGMPIDGGANFNQSRSGWWAFEVARAEAEVYELARFDLLRNMHAEPGRYFWAVAMHQDLLACLPGCGVEGGFPGHEPKYSQIEREKLVARLQCEGII